MGEFTDLGKRKEKAELPAKKRAILVYEEHNYADESKEPAKFYGYREKFKSRDERNQVPNYALMIYDVSIHSQDAITHTANLLIKTQQISKSLLWTLLLLQKKRKGFRLVPVENHVRFEKVKTAQRKAAEEEKPAMPQIDIKAALEKRGIPTGAPAKKENMLSKLRNTLRKNIATTNRSIMTVGGAQDDPKK